MMRNKSFAAKCRQLKERNEKQEQILCMGGGVVERADGASGRGSCRASEGTSMSDIEGRAVNRVG